MIVCSTASSLRSARDPLRTARRLSVRLRSRGASPSGAVDRAAGRPAKGLTQVELAEKAGLRRATVSEVESGKAKRIDLATLDKLSIALDTDPGLLIVREGKRRKP